MDMEKNMELAKQVYGTVCSALDNRELKYEKNDEKLEVILGASGEDLPMLFRFDVQANKQLLTLTSLFPFTMSEEKRVDGAIAACVVSNRLAHGNFEYDIAKGEISFRIAESFVDSLIGEGLINYMLSAAASLVEEYNDKFLALNKGLIEISAFFQDK